MAGAVRCLLVAVLLGHATAILLEQHAAHASKPPHAGAAKQDPPRKDRQTMLVQRRTLAMLNSRCKKAAAYLEVQAIKLNAGEMVVLALRTAKTGDQTHDATVAEFKELRSVIHKVLAGGADGVIAGLQEFCTGEVTKTGQNLTHFEDLKKKADAELVQLATKADDINKALARLKPGMKKTRRKLSAMRKAQATEHARWKKANANAKLSKVINISRDTSVENAAKLTKANNAAVSDFMKHLNDQMQEATIASSSTEKEHLLELRLEASRAHYNDQEKQVKMLKDRLMTKARGAQALEGTVKSLQQYSQQLHDKCGKGNKGQGKEEFAAIQAAYRILSGENP